MKVGELVDILSKFNPDAQVVIHRDNFNYGFGKISKVYSGLFEETDFGNDFLLDEEVIINPTEVRAVCLYPEDVDPPESVLEESDQ